MVRTLNRGLSYGFRREDQGLVMVLGLFSLYPLLNLALCDIKIDRYRQEQGVGYFRNIRLSLDSSVPSYDGVVRGVVVGVAVLRVSGGRLRERKGKGRLCL